MGGKELKNGRMRKKNIGDRSQNTEFKTDCFSPVSCILSSSFLTIPSFQFSIIPIRVEVFMKIPLYQIDAFASKVFAGNPAAVCPLDGWLEDALMQAVAMENNLSETAFFVPLDQGYHIRWFTPAAEVDLCGHATLASAYTIFTHIDSSKNEVTFQSRSGPLTVAKQGDLLAMDFPAQPPSPCESSAPLIKALGAKPLEVLRSEDYFVVFPSEQDVRGMDPDMGLLRKVDLRGVIVTAKGKKVDFVSRFFAPKYGVNEDPVTGSAHCALIPYWSGKLGRKDLIAHQVSKRGGELFCKDRGDRVIIAGRAVSYMEGVITI
jgi:PhzF family phenazine biosynthesis protein